MHIQTAYKANAYSATATAARSPRGSDGPDDVRDEFDNRRRGGDGPDDVYDEYDNSRGRGSDSGSSYDSWGGGGGSDYIGGMLI